MSEFTTLIGQILLITCVQMFLEMFIDADKRPYLSKVANIACYAVGVYFLVQFLFDTLMREVLEIVSNVF
ncbi:MAG: hypothetical protein FWE91_02900 [Defluviitaleaceae bacterium]|nr:hypothetical protein [Defluviitaleaceae bacterium]MCL2835945.1 hypothetical protein [Defluviitaleaceae bacterium]